MRVYEERTLKQIYCNRCGKELQVSGEIVMEGVFSVDYRWGYFSKRDGIKSSFDLCENCYDEMIKKFVYPVEEEEYLEML